MLGQKTRRAQCQKIGFGYTFSDSQIICYHEFALKIFPDLNFVLCKTSVLICNWDSIPFIMNSRIFSYSISYLCWVGVNNEKWWEIYHNVHFMCTWFNTETSYSAHTLYVQGHYFTCRSVYCTDIVHSADRLYEQSSEKPYLSYKIMILYFG